jgi:hypothetical protein
MNKFIDLLAESVIIQGILTLAVVGTWLYMLATSVPVPDTLNNILGIVVGFYFGGKVSLAIANARRG